MKVVKFIAVAALLMSFQTVFGQTKMVQITTIESTVAAGFGRSMMIITDENGMQKEVELNNLFSAFGINFKNIKGNETTITSTIRDYLDGGYELLSTIPLTLSPADGGSNTGIFMTRYTLIKKE